MYKLTLILSLFVLGISGKNIASRFDMDMIPGYLAELTDDDLDAALDIVFCVCGDDDQDGKLGLDELTSGVCEVNTDFRLFY